MIVIEGGRFKKRDYRTFKIKEVEGTDDYASMKEALTRRFSHLSDESGSFSEAPDLILLDGGAAHVSVVKELLCKLGLNIPVFGMVKDEHHKTRALCTEQYDISISREQDVFRFVYGIQEEVHRYSIKRMSDAKRKTMKTSSLTRIKGIGEAKAKKLLESFDSIEELKNATAREIQEKGFSERDAASVADFFEKEKLK